MLSAVCVCVCVACARCLLLYNKISSDLTDWTRAVFAVCAVCAMCVLSAPFVSALCVRRSFSVRICAVCALFVHFNFAGFSIRTC